MIARIAFIAGSLSMLLPAQSVSGGQIYQAAAHFGIAYVAPTSGQAIASQKSALNWKAILAAIITDGSLAAAGGGLTKVISIGVRTEEALMAIHEIADREITPRLAAAAPNPNAIPPVLQVGEGIAPVAPACVERSIYAAKAVGGQILLGGLEITFAPQRAAKVAKGLQVIDVLACIPQ